MARILLLSHCVIYMRVANSLNNSSADEYRDPEARLSYVVVDMKSCPCQALTRAFCSAIPILHPNAPICTASTSPSGYEVLSCTDTDSRILRYDTDTASICDTIDYAAAKFVFNLTLQKYVAAVLNKI